MREFSTVELTQKIGDVTHLARREPVAITQHRKPRFVLMSIEDYERLVRRGDTRQAWTSDNVPDDLADEIETALKVYEAKP
ncbi:type II toxin-antitoxin system prevent-host-death family antitoxin [Mesorhizobium sp. CN2-181]|uniref:type II toxin-antitoxin system prevent-host-death family antitoxin n=1 Tax=Mesorhizobium yinganensis TaxID=3157707 RepID=UPI0032B75E8A